MAKKPAAKAAKGGGKKQAAKDKAKKSASASKGTKAVKAKAAENDAERTRKVIGESKLKALISKVRGFQDTASSAGGDAGQAISEAVKKDGLNAPAFRIAMRLQKAGMNDPLKLRILLDDLDYYRDVLKLDDLAGDSLFAPREGAQDDGDEDEADGGSELAEPSDSDVVQFPGNGSESRHSAA